jgi:hypothetical protein
MLMALLLSLQKGHDAPSWHQLKEHPKVFNFECPSEAIQKKTITVTNKSYTLGRIIEEAFMFTQEK